MLVCASSYHGKLCLQKDFIIGLKYTLPSTNNTVSVAIATTTAKMLSLMEPKRG